MGTISVRPRFPANLHQGLYLCVLDKTRVGYTLARGPLRRGAQLGTIGPIGFRPARAPSYDTIIEQCLCSVCSPGIYIEREMFYLTTHSTHSIYGYMASDIWLRTFFLLLCFLNISVIIIISVDGKWPDWSILRRDQCQGDCRQLVYWSRTCTPPTGGGHCSGPNWEQFPTKRVPANLHQGLYLCVLDKTRVGYTVSQLGTISVRPGSQPTCIKVCTCVYLTRRE